MHGLLTDEMKGAQRGCMKSSCGSEGATAANSGRGGIGDVLSWWGGSTLVETACFVAEWVRGEEVEGGQ